jgi:hypothetical protein
MDPTQILISSTDVGDDTPADLAAGYCAPPNH